jgi:thiamine biosynthesis lipoprotein
MFELSFRAMGCSVHALVNGPTELGGFVEGRIAQLEARWSRFIDTSEVSQLNRAEGAAVLVSADTVELLERSWDGRSVGHGWFEPFILDAVEASGYDRDYASLLGARRLPSDDLRAAADPGADDRVASALAEIEFDRVGSRVRLPSGLRLDPGAIGKGLAADIVTRELVSRGAQGAMVNIGGDLRSRGFSSGKSSGLWPVVVVHPISGAEIASAQLGDAAVATSSTLLRTWQVGEQRKHHLLDPHTGRSLVESPGRPTVASAIASEGWMAEALATSAICSGSPVDTLDGWTVLVDEQGNVTYGGQLPGPSSRVQSIESAGSPSEASGFAHTVLEST